METAIETAIRWSPASNADEQRFLYVDVSGKSFKLCRVTSGDSTSLNYDVLVSHSRAPVFRAFDWSPVDETLVAVGQASGEATILRLDDDYQAPIVFSIRNQRYCNAVAFSTQGLLAAGLDKVRNDFCLNIWDVNQRLSVTGSRGYGSDRHALEPLRKLASSEPITSIKFFRDQPDTLVTGVKGQFVRIYDLREGSGNPSLQFPTRCVHNLAIDWLDENYIASGNPSGDPTICIWDRRSGARFPSAALPTTDSSQLSAALEFRNVIDPKSSIWSLRFSRTKRGCLGMLSSDGDFKAYDMAKEYVSDENRTSLDQTLGRNSATSYPEQIYTKTVRDFRNPYFPHDRSTNPSQKVASFDFLNFSASNEPTTVTLLANRSVALFTLQSQPCPMDLSSQSVLARGGLGEHDLDFKLIRPSSESPSRISKTSKRTQDRSTSPTAQPNGSSATIGDNKNGGGRSSPDSSASTKVAQRLPSRESRERSLSAGMSDTRLTVRDALAWMSIPRLRCQEGYLVDGEANKELFSDDPGLWEFWDWVGRARENSIGDSMIINSVDMNYIGVYSIWNERLGQSLEDRVLRSNVNQTIDINNLIIDLVKALGIPEGKGCTTRFPAHRRLCLRISGAAESTADLEAIVNNLVEARQHTKAAALALFQDEPKLALLALRKNQPTQGHKLLAMAISGAAKGDTDPYWEETCREIGQELADPYARAILALVGKGDWNSVIGEVTLPLKYRLEVALRWLPDDELTSYLRDATMDAIRQGNIEGVVLTGLDHGAMDLFQSYIDKFGDIQTPVLAMSHTVPRFITDPQNSTRYEAWRETYRRQINSWKLQLDRARFDVESRKLAVTWYARKLIKPPPQQISLVCNYCTRPLSQQDGSEYPDLPSTGMEVVHSVPMSPLGTASQSGTICPKCGRHMPRCGICSLWLGTADPMSRASIAGGSTNKQASEAPQEDVMKRFVVFCINCNHGFHAHHARDWFRKHKICPVAECHCICDR
ncbi:ubiquitin-protein ligase E3 [Blastomyces gilchristii SLH14081]|uniref:Ubiquitin-protein ligase E3 n=1 Tax=Blastomyces gilchristii (strain SLH14081) TaxID=559298 RepID=A0A179ULG7_BLAGS|nr:ubiquitin-protein ligase E3 [Blastomyces gilchristii SLH14081]OAT08730.1 ubiquitin-protein ligase E3 [Blastomyces gilchristii SLH14081]